MKQLSIIAGVLMALPSYALEHQFKGAACTVVIPGTTPSSKELYVPVTREIVLRVGSGWGAWDLGTPTTDLVSALTVLTNLKKARLCKQYQIEVSKVIESPGPCIANFDPSFTTGYIAINHGFIRNGLTVENAFAAIGMLTDLGICTSTRLWRD